MFPGIFCKSAERSSTKPAAENTCRHHELSPREGILWVEERGVPAKHWPGAPDLAIEVLSPNDSYSYMQEKACDWIGYGARMVLVVDPDKRLVSVYRSRQEVRILTVDEAIDGGDTVPGWRVEIRELFAE